jgi:tRNA/tmRNA/rRNA uracil-C5-methylase (TrmA/RlmC/RlmD family)
MTAVGAVPAESAAQAALESLPAGPDDGLDGATLELIVGAVAHGGCCVARHEGQVVLVRHALPGERVRAVVTEEHGSYLRADAVEILDASPHRVRPPCPFAGPGLCGGCDLQHAELGYQRELKAAVVREQLQRLAGIHVPVTVAPLPGVPGEPDGQGWRTRVQYTVDSTGRAGLLAHRSHEVVPVDRCLIAHPTVREADILARDWAAHDSLEVVAGTAAPAAVLGRAGGRPVLLSGPESVTERAVGREWRLPPTAFWQVHPAAADSLAGAVVDLLQPRAGDRIWDLYGGAGLFAAALAPHAEGSGRITVVEGDPAAAAAARANLRDLTTITVVHADVARALANPRWRSVDLVVLDPPRSGAGAAVVAAVTARTPRAVAYVACDPAALARDVQTFRSHGYDLAQLRAYDLFPNTHHVECVALLQRSR